MRHLQCFLVCMFVLLGTSAYAHHPLVLGEPYIGPATFCNIEITEDCPKSSIGFIQLLASVDNEVSSRENAKPSDLLGAYVANEFLDHMLRGHCQSGFARFIGREVIQSWNTVEISNDTSLDSVDEGRFVKSRVTALWADAYLTTGDTARVVAIVTAKIQKKSSRPDEDVLEEKF